MMNKIEEQDGRFKAITGDMCVVPIHGNVVINTSCEHITQEQYESWLSNVPKDSLIVLQSNNYRIPEHVRISTSLQEFEEQSHINKLYSGSLRLPLYTRHMIIGRKY
jgi:flavorubredoxin